ncbi:MAG: N-6 DNA methylase [Thiofilum sp.]|uniref:HsdM family class I SAM-dependent methyltransferase n=1 Tax=Thiofilum sp. TaxID=2212733 RepID=UPI0025FC8D4B|nr:N-6 DNA methylase [Thiofilum sp.]MBK8452555.1 N-6 DNA methylase [Thiofilum sp.]
MSADKLIDFVNNTLFPGLQSVNPNIGKKEKVIHTVFSESHNYMKSGQLMQEVIEKLDEAIDFHDFRTRANLGDVYEQILNDLRGAGNAGEFYTPRAITQFMVQMVNPRLDKREKVLDPACGTGGFLTATIDHFNHQITDKSGTEDKKAIEELIFGFEKKPLPHLLCTTNLLLHGIDAPSQIEHRNTLARAWNDWSKAEKMDCIVTNPPFGGYEEDAVGGTYPADLRTRETADMFMALIVKKLLKDDGGRAAVVLPDGFMFGDGIKGKLKEKLLKECKLHTIVRLPKGVFAPYTTIKTNLLFFTRRTPETDDDADQDASFATDTIWFYEHPYPPGYKSYSKTKPIRLEEFDAEKAWWGTEDNDFADREETELAWKFDFKTLQAEKWAEAKPHWEKAADLNNQASALENEAKDLRKSLVGSTDTDYRKQIGTQIEELRVKAEPLRLKARDAQAAGDRIYWPIFNLDQKNPNTPEEESHDPDVLLDKYKKLLGEIEETENTLKSELAAALAHHFVEEEAA